MKDLIFNELSIDFSYSNAPSSEQDAFDILKKFVECCLAYALALGAVVFVREYGNTSGDTANLSTTNLWHQENIYKLLKNPKTQAKFTDDEILRFKQMIAELSIRYVDPEYTYKTKEVFGIGKAIVEESYLISLFTHDEWRSNQITNVQKVTLMLDFSSSLCPVINNISTLSHVFSDHEVWKSCEYKHLKPKLNYLLPHYERSKLIPQAFGYSGWTDFYTNYRNGLIDRTQGLKVTKVLAAVNGWKDIGKKQDNEWNQRDTYKTKEYYLQVDTEQLAFEVYNGATNHVGELKYDSETINTKKADSRRFIRI